MKVVGNRSQTTAALFAIFGLARAAGVDVLDRFTTEQLDSFAVFIEGLFGLFLALKVKNGRNGVIHHRTAASLEKDVGGFAILGTLLLVVGLLVIGAIVYAGAYWDMYAGWVGTALFLGIGGAFVAWRKTTFDSVSAAVHRTPRVDPEKPWPR